MLNRSPSKASLQYKAVCLVGALLLLMPVGTYGFDDVAVNSPFYEATESLKTRSILSQDNQTFDLERSLTRAELIKVALVSNDIPLEHDLESPFPDLDTSTWQYNMVMTAYSQGIVQGYPDGTFRPNDPVTYIEAMKIILGAHFDELPAVDADLYVDAGQSDWWSQYILLAEQKNLYTSPSTRRFGISEVFPRKYMAQILYRSLEVTEQNLPRYDGKGNSGGGYVPYTPRSVNIEDWKAESDARYQEIQAKIREYELLKKRIKEIQDR